MTPHEAAARCQRLTPHLVRVLELAGIKGMRYAEISVELSISEQVVRNYAGAIRRALGARTLTHAAVIATKGGVL
jgi:DNA-binding NarL/FixJ family response regulator